MPVETVPMVRIPGSVVGRDLFSGCHVAQQAQETLSKFSEVFPPGSHRAPKDSVLGEAS